MSNTIQKLNVMFPKHSDVKIACQIIANGTDQLTKMLSNEESEQFYKLSVKWMKSFEKYKEEVINEMIEEL